MSNYQMNSKEFIMLAGPPCSGKSTYANVYVERGYALISTDKFIEEYAEETNKTYGEVFEDYFKTALKLMNAELETAIKEGKNIIWDQTNLSRESRLKKRERIPDDYIKKCVYFDVSYRVLLDRNEKRYKMTGKYIPEDVLMKMAVQAEPPTDDEKWHVVMTKVITE